MNLNKLMIFYFVIVSFYCSGLNAQSEEGSLQKKENQSYSYVQSGCIPDETGNESFDKVELYDSMQSISVSDTVPVMQNNIFPLPILFYTPETGLAGGGMALYLIRDLLNNSNERPSNISGDIIYTAKKQVIIELNSDIYFDTNNYRLMFNIVYKNYPDKFYGIGNNTSSGNEEGYTSKTFFVKTTLSKNIYSKMNAGALFQLESTSILNKEPGRYLIQGNISGSAGSIISGAGFLVNWDSRDNIFSAYSGSFCQLSSLFNSKAFGGNFNYTDITLDMRHFIELFPSQILAIQGLMKILEGNVPFQNLVSYGGQDVIRGYTLGQYRDKSGAAIQAEYRFPAFWRIGAVVFGGFGQVADNISNLKLDEFKFAGGAGIRFLLDPKERVCLRLDFGYGQTSSGMYISAGQAF